VFGLHTSWPKPRLQSVGSDSGPDLLNVVVDGNPVDLVESFTYLGSIQTSDGYCRSDITRQIGLASSAMLSLSNIWNTKYLSIQTKVCVSNTGSVNPAISIQNMDLACQWHESHRILYMKCQRRILGIRWHDFVGNSEVSLCTGLAPVSHWITRGRNAIFRHVSRLPDNIPAHQAMLSVSRPPDPTWKRSPGRPHAKWTDHLCHKNNNASIAALWRQAIGRGHSRSTLRSELTTC